MASVEIGLLAKIWPLWLQKRIPNLHTAVSGYVTCFANEIECVNGVLGKAERHSWRK